MPVVRTVHRFHAHAAPRGRLILSNPLPAQKKADWVVPRPARTIDPTRPLAEFASGLQALRRDANLTLSQLSERTRRAKSVLSEATSGAHLPRWAVVEAYVRACGGPVEEWRLRWERASDRWAAARGLLPVQETREPTGGQGRREEVSRPGGRRALAAPAGNDDPTQVETPAELAAALNALRRGRGLSLTADPGPADHGRAGISR